MRCLCTWPCGVVSGSGRGRWRRETRRSRRVVAAVAEVPGWPILPCLRHRKSSSPGRPPSPRRLWCVRESSRTRSRLVPPPTPAAEVPSPPPQPPDTQPPAPAASAGPAATGAGTGPGTGGGLGGGNGEGVGPGQGPASGPGPGGGGNAGTVRPPELRDLAFPFDTPPKELRGASLAVTFWVRVDGQVDRYEVDPAISDREYARKFDEVIRAFRFTPARAPDGTRVAGTTTVTFTLPARETPKSHSRTRPSPERGVGSLSPVEDL